ncbi:hypothetical protein Fmac_021099 [Flemingia macrophylla]|uniref:Prolamin-like domain-containing protein n=1 Tax=Flemingia macrophylla TaxID=520843 RepID=A0ABD1LVW0_9FABA
MSTTIATSTAPDKEEILLECAQHIGYYCGNQIFDVLLSHANTMISEDCCYKLIQTGYSCHTKLALSILQNDPEFRHENVTRVLSNSNRIFHTCDQATQPKDDMYLSKCVVKIGTDCGKQVFEKLVQSKSNDISGCCCRKLVEMGLSCHMNMAKKLILTPKMRDVDAVEFLKRSKNVFHQCRRRE